MRTKIFLSFLCVCMGYTFAFAQLSTGSSTTHVIKTGNRPQKGDFGIFIGPSYSEIKDMIDNDVKFRGLPLVNFKYYSSPQIEWRLGLQFYKKSEKLKGDAISSSEGEGKAFEELGSIKSKNLESFNRITPGIAYHFSSHNILDVYVGASLPLGWERNKTVNESEYDGEKEVNNCSRSSFVIGAGGFIGLQAFIADLPFSVGLEYGFSGLLHTGLKYKHEVTTDDGTQTYYTNYDSSHDLKDDGNWFDKLHSKKGEFGSDVRVTLSYYFNKK